MMSISNTNHLISGTGTGSITDTFTPGKKKENLASKLHQYQNYATVNMND